MDLMSRRSGRGGPWWSVTIAAAILIVAAVGFVHHLLGEPRVVLLRSREGAQWIRVDRPFDSSARFDHLTAAVFAVQASIPDGFASAVLRVDALRRVVVNLDGRDIYDSGPVLEDWKTERLVPLPAGLPSGIHLLRFAVSNRDGPSMLRVICPELNLRSSSLWRAMDDQVGWSSAAPADREVVPHLPPQFGPTVRQLWRLSPYLITVMVAGAMLMSRRPSTVDWGSRVRWLLLLAWGALAVNNIFKLPLEFGYDADQHTLYIQFVADHLSLPRPDAGWQFFQSPLYYILSGLLDRSLVAMGVSTGNVPYLLRVIPLLCGAAMIEVCYRSARLVYPNRFDLQAITTTVCGLLPVNIYMAHAVSNEPMSAVMSGLITLLALRILVYPEKVQSRSYLVATGAVLGTAWLTKINTAIWVVPLGTAMVFALHRQRAKAKAWFRAIGITGGMALVVSGWYLIRNLYLVGKPFYLESSLADNQWWQEPGYRTPRMFYEFGHVFARPIYNGLSSVWDSLYGTLWGNGIVIGHPAWNFGLMSCGLWLALLPMGAIFIGIWQAIWKPEPALKFAVLAIGCFIPAILYVYLTLPIYSCAKASYMLGTAPCIGLLAAAGMDRLMINRSMRCTACAGLICWAMTAYLTFFITG